MYKGDEDRIYSMFLEAKHAIAGGIKSCLQ